MERSHPQPDLQQAVKDLEQHTRIWAYVLLSFIGEELVYRKLRRLVATTNHRLRKFTQPGKQGSSTSPDHQSESF